MIIANKDEAPVLSSNYSSNQRKIVGVTEDQPADEDEERKEAFQKLQASVNDITNLEASPELNNDDIFLEMA